MTGINSIGGGGTGGFDPHHGKSQEERVEDAKDAMEKNPRKKHAIPKTRGDVRKRVKKMATPPTEKPTPGKDPDAGHVFDSALLPPEIFRSDEPEDERDDDGVDITA